MPCVVSGFGTDFKRYVLEHDMSIVREDNLEYLTNRSRQVYDRIGKILLQFPTCGSLVYYSTNEEILKRYITDPEILDYIQFTSEMSMYPQKYQALAKVLAQDVFYFHHGLKFCSKKCLNYIRGKLMVDGGAFIGDSASVLLHHYSPSKVVSFDVSPINYNLYVQTMIRNKFSAS